MRYLIPILCLLLLRAPLSRLIAKPLADAKVQNKPAEAIPSSRGIVTLSFSVVKDLAYLVESTGVLSEAQWAVLTNISASESREFETTIPIDEGERFFRVRVSGTNTLIIPPGFENSFSPYNGGLAWSPVNYQLFYGRTNFPKKAAEVIQISGIAFRMDESFTIIDVVVPRVRIWASTFSKPSNQLSKQRHENWGPDRILVYDEENVRLRAMPAGPAVFQIPIGFQKPFLYQNQRGHLLLDFRTEGNYSGIPGGTDGAFNNDGSLFLLRNGGGGELVIEPFADILQVYYTPVPVLKIIAAEKGVPDNP